MKLKIEKKQIAIITLIILVIILALTICITKKVKNDTNNAKDQSKINIGKDTINKTKNVGDYKIFNAECSHDGEKIKFECYIKNISNNNKKNVKLQIELLGENEEVLKTLNADYEEIISGEIVQYSIEMHEKEGFKNVINYRVIEK